MPLSRPVFPAAQALSGSAPGRGPNFGNGEPVVGRVAVRDAWAAFCADLHGVSHDLVERWEAGAATIVEARVTYTRADDSTVAVPVVTKRIVGLIAVLTLLAGAAATTRTPPTPPTPARRPRRRRPRGGP